jgi:hypothetical protein
MAGIRAESRTALIAQVQVSWEEQDGPHQDVRGRMEDTSPSGACIRLKMPIGVGANIRIKSHREDFSGITRYCRREGGDYVLGIRRNTKAQEKAKTAGVAPAQEISVSKPAEPEPGRSGLEPAKRSGIAARTETNSLATAIATSQTSVASAGQISDLNVRQGIAGTEGCATRKPDLQTPHSSAVKERKSMPTKWLDMALNRQKHESSNGKTNSAPPPVEHATTEVSLSQKHPSSKGAKEPIKFLGDLQPLEDVYRSAGIMNPRMGYSITKVMEMLSNDHIRNLPDEAKRAAVLMALDAAGISVEEIVRDARQRRDALDAYETAQRRQFEDYWARKAEGNALIQAELDRVTAQSLERIKQNLDEIAAERGEFERWQAMKQQEAERIAEAAGLFSNQSAPEPPSASLLPLRAPESVGKPS